MAAFEPVDPKPSFPELEQAILAFWREADVFHRQLDLRRDGPLWVFYEGPPTANGQPGIHHTESRTFKDIYPRFRAMTGHFVPRKAGWDCPNAITMSARPTTRSGFARNTSSTWRPCCSCWAMSRRPRDKRPPPC